MEIRELDNDIKSGRLKKVYFFYGPEIFLIENKINSIKKRFVNKELEEFCISKFNGKESNFEEFEDEFNSYPMSGDRKLIILQNTGWFNNSKSAEFTSIKSLFSDVPEYLYIIIREDNYDKKKEKNLEFIKNSGGDVVFFDYLPLVQLCTWIEKIFSDNGKIIRQSDVLYIANACNLEMGKINSEVNKILVFSGECERISSKDISALVAKSCDYKIYELFDDIVDANGKMSIKKLKHILDSKEKPTSVIVGLTNKFSELLTIKLLHSDRVSISDMMNYMDFKIPEFVIKKMINQNKRYDEKYLKRIIRKGIDFDRLIKSGRIDQRVAAEMFVSELIR